MPREWKMTLKKEILREEVFEKSIGKHDPIRYNWIPWKMIHKTMEQVIFKTII